MLRHIDFTRTNEQLQDLEKFLKEVNGRKYGLKYSDLLKQRHTVMRLPKDKDMMGLDGQPQNLVEEERSFFCSELVAKCFKVCKIM